MYHIMGMSRVIGCVKWFNTKTGYGFITYENEDIFVHHANLKVDNNQYKYLVQGEYVEFEKTTIEHAKHTNNATEVTGVHRGLLMCETRLKAKEAQEQR
jgi:CspA family cold shock protein